MKSVRHPNVLSFFGAGVNQHERPYLVTELMPMGSLRSLLVDGRRKLRWAARLQFISDIAEGMRYLHESVGTVHRDLKVCDVLVLVCLLQLVRNVNGNADVCFATYTRLSTILQLTSARIAVIAV
jgi:serine/threonine protein kinase